MNSSRFCQGNSDKNLPPAGLCRKVQTQTPSLPLDCVRTNYPLTPRGFRTPSQSFDPHLTKYTTRTGGWVHVMNTSSTTPFQTSLRNQEVSSATITSLRGASGYKVQAQSSTFRDLALHPSANGLLTHCVAPTPVRPMEFASVGAVAGQSQRNSLFKSFVPNLNHSEEVAMPLGKPDIQPVQVVSPRHKSPNGKGVEYEKQPTLSLRTAVPTSAVCGNIMRNGSHLQANISSQYHVDGPTQHPSAFRSGASSSRPVSGGFQETLLDMEVTLLTGVYRSRNRSTSHSSRALGNPLEKLFLEGDSQVFIYLFVVIVVIVIVVC